MNEFHLIDSSLLEYVLGELEISIEEDEHYQEAFDKHLDAHRKFLQTAESQPHCQFVEKSWHMSEDALASAINLYCMNKITEAIQAVFMTAK